MAFRNVCFTAWCTDRDLFEDVPAFVKYAVYQREIAPETGKKHYQGYAEFNNTIKMNRIKAWLGDDAHLEKRKGTNEQARNYCMKPDSRDDTDDSGPFEHGTFSATTAGARTDIADACAYAKENGISACADMFPEVYAKYWKGIQAYLAAIKQKPTDKDFEPRPWQSKILAELDKPISERTIYWVHESRGNIGKSRLAHHLCCEHGAIELHGKVADMAYGYNDEPIVIFDLARTQEDCYKHLYAFAEKLKNGRFFSPKYESGMRLFEPPNVIFFANFAPPTDAWSADRVFEFDLNCPDHHV
ncbi:MAG: putative viral replication protein [Cressdnaviricota sp.]|nr:MAG: putative viral replication protein [Cressdnaviricota sp.]